MLKISLSHWVHQRILSTPTALLSCGCPFLFSNATTISCLNCCSWLWTGFPISIFYFTTVWFSNCTQSNYFKTQHQFCHYWEVRLTYPREIPWAFCKDPGQWRKDLNLRQSILTAYNAKTLDPSHTKGGVPAFTNRTVIWGILLLTYLIICLWTSAPCLSHHGNWFYPQS